MWHRCTVASLLGNVLTHLSFFAEICSPLHCILFLEEHCGPASHLVRANRFKIKATDIYLLCDETEGLVSKTQQ